MAPTPFFDINQEALEMALWRWKKPIRFFAECDSTNNRAVAWARQGAKEGSIVVTDHQTEGRGRGDKTWFDLPNLGSLLFSVILRPKLPPDKLAIASMAVAVSTSLGLAERKTPQKLRWPNDIYSRGRKLGGLLAEAEIEGDHTNFVVVGVGVNMRISRDQFPKEMQATATSAVLETGRSYDPDVVIAGILIHLDRALQDIAAGRTGTILNQYRHLCETIGKTLAYRVGKETVRAVAVDVDEAGGLILDSGVVLPGGEVAILDE